MMAQQAAGRFPVPDSQLALEGGTWLAVWLGPAVWATAAGAGYVIASRACAAGKNSLAETAVVAIGALATIASLYAMIHSYRRWHGAREHRRFMAGARADNVASFVAWAGVTLSGLAALGSLFIAIAPLFLTPCVRSW